MIQRGASHELHCDKHLAVLLANLINRADVGVIQRGCRTRLSAKTLEGMWVLGQVVRKKLKRDKPSKRSVLGLVHNTHAAAAQLFDDAVVGDSFADHWNDAVRATSRLASLKASVVVIQETVELGERTGLSPRSQAC